MKKFRIYFRGDTVWFRPSSDCWGFFYDDERVLRDKHDSKTYLVYR